MAEVMNMPKPGGGASAMTREHSSLESPEVQEVKAEILEDPQEKGSAIRPKKSLGQKFKETFIKEDIADVRDYIVWDIIVPRIGQAINDIICGASTRIFVGGGVQPSSNLRREHGVTRPNRDYAGVSSRRGPRPVGYSNQTSQPSRPANYEVLDLTFRAEDYAQLQQAFDQTIDYLDTYGQVSIDTYADILSEHFDNIPHPNYTAQSWGWTSLTNASIINAVGGGYFLKMPRPTYLKN